MSKLLELKDITAGYEGRPALLNVNLTVHDNDFIGVIGPNGGGKTTLLKVIVQLLKPISGQLCFCDGFSPYQIGYLPQRSQNDISFPITAEEVILSGYMSGSYRRGFFVKSDKAAAKRLIHEIGIEHIAGKPIDSLSGGEFQKVMLCRSIVSNPKLLILDEPNTFVDHNFEAEMHQMLKELNKRMAIIMVSHDLGNISSSVKTIACVNRTLTHHQENKIDEEIILSYNCPVDIIAHGHVPHRVLRTHEDKTMMNDDEPINCMRPE